MSGPLEVRVPDIGDFKNVPILEVLVQAGVRVETDAPLITLESDKATIDVPAPRAGTVRDIMVKPGERVSQGSLILTLEEGLEDAARGPAQRAETPLVEGALAIAVAEPSPSLRPDDPVEPDTQVEPAPTRDTSTRAPSAGSHFSAKPARVAYASPSVRVLCRKLGVEPAEVRGTGPRGRILGDDVHTHVKRRLATGDEASRSTRPGEPWPRIDFERFGMVDRQPLSRIARRMAANLARNWTVIPHVTNFEEADVTELESFRERVNRERREGEAKLTVLAFLVKASAAALRRFPEFNASLDADTVVRKHYCHVGFATDTPDGLVVPVIRDVDTKGLSRIAAEAAEKISLARAGKLKPSDFEGGCFTVSSLGNISGTGFAPIINAPEIAILGAAKARILPRWDGSQFQPQLTLPLSLSWDHRAVSGAAAGRFLAFIAAQLSDLRQLLL